jgi:hypothetical protein
MKARALVLCSLVLLIVPALYARGKKAAPTAPGTYKDWGPDIDEITINQTFKIADYDKIVVEPIDTTSTPLPDQKEKWYGTMKSALAASTEWFMESFRKELKAKADVEESSSPGKKSKTLIIKSTIDSMDPGSRAGRYFGGFGAGSASAKVSADIVDAKSGKVLAHVIQARRSAGTWKGAGGSDLDVMRDSIHAIAQDMAHILDAF